MKAVVLAAGEGRRLQPLTSRRPKPMIPVANKPVLEYVVEAVAEAGIEEVVLVVGYKRERIQTYFENGDKWDIEITYAIQDAQLGTGHAVQQVQSLVDNEFLVLNGDRIIDADLVEEVRETESRETPATISVTRVEPAQEYGITVTDDDGLVRIDEKPTGESQSTVINAGVYRFTDTIFEAIEKCNRSPDGEVCLPSAINHLATETTVDIVKYHGRWLDVTYPWDLLFVNDTIVTAHEAPENGQVAESATVTDRVHIGEGTAIHANATVKRGTSLGPNVTVGTNAVVSNAVVMQDATIDDGAVVRDCIVDENVTIGPNATVAGGTATVAVEETVHTDVTLGGVIGANTRLGGGAVISPGTVIGDDVTVRDGTTVGGQIESNATIYRG
ncbi:sugar phosphate nucleotidyltransferase [Halovenus rubra]|uniref:Sugar phosphate nucleotidyltransferase n=2 Tax=Halovenus rubra TaxID=869890 RepID=A0ACC7DW57_9EURY|nr:sugar phosphate nucleotidyltransferase [Halovenus rubra]